MKKILLIFAILITSFTYANSEQKCKDLPGFKKIGKDSQEFLKCLADNNIKINTDSKLTDLITGKEKIKIPNPITGLKNIGKALKPSILDK
jgi:hypothetical protein